jgi:hypothetical protein
MRLKERDLEMYGLPFTPDFVYNVINRLPRFSSMRVSFESNSEYWHLIQNSVVINKMQRSFLVSCSKGFMTSASKSCVHLTLSQLQLQSSHHPQRARVAALKDQFLEKRMDG